MQTFGQAVEVVFLRLLKREIDKLSESVTGLSIKDFDTYKQKCGEIAALRKVPDLLAEARDVVDGKIKLEEQ